jgi:putative flippase GtrA/GT2 family glycosyltransferase
LRGGSIGEDPESGKRPVFTGPSTTGQLSALAVLESLARLEQTEQSRPSQPAWEPEPAQEEPPSLLRRHWARFSSFSVIGGVIFLAGLAIQAVLTGGMHVQPFVSYLVQAIVSIEASFLLNRWVTWRRRGTAFWPAFLRFNAQKTLTVAANLALYVGLLKLGVNYLVANVLLTVAFTIVNYVAGDKFVFVAPEASAGPVEALQIPRGERALFRTVPGLRPSVSIVIPVRSNERTIRPAVESLLRQNYPELREILLIGSPDDTTWQALQGIDDPRLICYETETPPGIRDANFKRNLGVRATSGALVALVDSDMVLPEDWLRNAVRALINSGADCVAGVMRTIHDDYWGRFVDNCRLAAKTPRVNGSYFVSSDDFGGSSRKPPITANILFTGEMYERCPIDSNWSHGSLEDYEWFWRVVSNGFRVLVTDQLFGWHDHRSGLKKLSGEYRRSARGCAYFIRAHSQSPFARKRLMQAITLPLAAFVGIAALAVATLTGHGMLAIAIAAGCVIAGGIALSIREFATTRTMESLTYPIPGLILGINYTLSLVGHLVRTPPETRKFGAQALDAPVSSPSSGHRAAPKASVRIWHPLTAILLLQVVLTIVMIRSNTAFGDEANYLELGRELIGHWLHGTPWREQYALDNVSGSTYFYPPIGALASMIGGLFAARLLSLALMLGATALLYATAARLFDSTTACCGAALWVVLEPTMQVGGFATFDALSVSLMALSGWLIVQAGFRRHRGEFVAAAGLALAASDLAAFSGITIDPLVVAYGFLVWTNFMGMRRAFYCTAWMVAATLAVFAGIMTVTKTWVAINTDVFSRAIQTGAGATALHIFEDSWTYTGVIMILAVIGAIAALSSGVGSRSMLACVLACAAFVIPAAQAYEGTAVSLPKHLAYGAWFAAIGAGYGCRRLTQQAGLGRLTVASAAAIALVYPAINGSMSTWHLFHTWANSQPLATSESAILPKVKGEIFISSVDSNAAYFLSGYYLRQNLASGKFVAGTPTVDNVSAAGTGALVLFFPVTTTNAGSVSAELMGAAGNTADRSKIFSYLEGSEAGGEQLAEVVTALDTDSQFKLTGVGPYSSTSDDMIYAVWVRT